MTTQQLAIDRTPTESAIQQVALALDALLVNGIQCGVLHHDIHPGFLQKVAGKLLRDLSSLEQSLPPNHPECTLIRATLTARSQELIDLLRGLESFRTLPLDDLRATVARIPPLRAGCVQAIQQLESCLQVPRPFYPSRPAHSAAAVNDFLASLDQTFTAAWTAAR